MKTITFYSYKGGTGRTLALANLAMCLSRLGKNVCVLDFDFEAPGLHHKFVDSFEDAKVEYGALDYIWKYIESNYEKQPESIAKYTRQIKLVGPKENGVIHFIPAGNVQSSAYWQKVTTPQFYQTFCFMPEGSMDAPRDRHYDPEKNINFFLKMKESIAEQLEPKPDYLLVDSRSGIIERVGVCLRLLADTIVFLFVNNQESLEGTRLIWRVLLEQPNLEGRQLNSIFALTRIPKMEEQRDLKIKEEKLNYLNEGIKDQEKKLKSEDIVLLHSDRELEIKEELYLKDKSSKKNLLLAHEYVHLFAHIIPEQAKGFTRIDQIVSFLKEILKLEESRKEEERIFTLYIEPGKMINPADGERNVSLRVKTFVNMLSDIYNDVVKRRLGEEKSEKKDMDEAEKKAKDEAETSFSHVGLVCGERFGNDLIEDVWKGGSSLSIYERLDNWCAFDSDVGFGRFSNEDIKEDDKDGVIAGKIKLTSNFLAADRKPEDPKLCKFMAGYIRGVLKELIGADVEVTHNPEDCMQGKPEKKECVFTFRRVE